MAVQIGFADDWLHMHALFRRFITGGGITPELGGVPKAGGNTGDGEITRIFGFNATITETWTITLTSPTAFDVTGSVSGAQASGTVGTPYSNSFLEFELDAGTVAFVATDEFTIEMTENPLETAGDKWAIIRENAVEALNTEMCLEAPGSAGLGVAPLHYFGIDTPDIGGVANPPFWRIISHSEYDIGNTFYGQVGYSGGNSPAMQCWEFKTKYWFIADKNRFIVISRVYDRYFVCSAGLLNAYATVPQWGQPHYVAGSSYGSFHWEDTNGAIGNFPAGSSSGIGSTASFMRIFRPDLLWDNVNNFYSGGDSLWQEEATADVIGVWPWSERRQISASGNVLTTLQGPIWKYLIEGPELTGGTFPLLPVQYYRREGASQATYGTVDGVYATTGGWLANEKSVASITNVVNPQRLANEDIITVGPDQYLCVPLVPYGRKRGHWAAFKLE